MRIINYNQKLNHDPAPRVLHQQTGGWLRYWAGLPVQDPRKAGFSDIRMWPCYILLCVSSLFFAQWLGIIWSTLLIGLPLFALAVRLAGVHKPQNAPIKSWKVYELIEANNREFDRKNHLLRRNTKIIQSDELEAKKSQKSPQALRYAKRA